MAQICGRGLSVLGGGGGGAGCCAELDFGERVVGAVEAESISFGLNLIDSARVRETFQRGVIQLRHTTPVTHATGKAWSHWCWMSEAWGL